MIFFLSKSHSVHGFPGAESGFLRQVAFAMQAFVDDANASEETSSVEAEWLPFQPNKVVEENELPNQGLEERGWFWVGGMCMKFGW